jgi:hypothetical protein
VISRSFGLEAPGETSARFQRWRGGEAASSSDVFKRGSIRTTGSRCRAWDPGFERFGFIPSLNTAYSYVATFAEAVYVVHAFEKRTRKTPAHELKVARDRYRALVNERRADDAKSK